MVHPYRKNGEMIVLLKGLCGGVYRKRWVDTVNDRLKKKREGWMLDKQGEWCLTKLRTYEGGMLGT